jgi:hypothetical protein
MKDFLLNYHPHFHPIVVNDIARFSTKKYKKKLKEDLNENKEEN